MKVVETFGKRMKEAMTLRGVRAIDISLNTGISKPQISNYLKDKYAPKREAIVKIARYLKVNEVWLIGYDDVEMERYEKNANGLKREITDLVYSINDENKLENIKKYIEVFVL